MRLNSTVRLTSDGTVQRVDLTYDVQDGDEVQVYFNDDEILTGWTLQRNTSPQRVDFDEKIPAGTLVLIRRYTDMRELPHFFHFTGNAKGGAEFNGKNLDENFDKILRAAQDAMDSFELVGINLEAASDARASANAAATSAANAANYATQANQRANSAQSSAVAAAGSANTANNHANRAEAALDGVAASAAAAEAAADRAGDSKTAAALSASAADQARLAAQASASTASASAVSAGNQASNAAASAAAASGYANTAGTHANAAAGSAAEALTHRNSAADSATVAAFSEDLAQKWAANPVGQVVEAGEYSAKHWAFKAAQTVVGAEDVITEDTSEIKFTGTGRALSPLQATIGSVDVSKVEGLGTAATRNVGEASGNVMEVGAFGLGGRGHRNNNLEGKSYLAHYDPHTLPTNYPAGEYGFGAMLSIAHGYPGTNMDMAFLHAPNSKILYRFGRHVPWVEIYHTGNFNPNTLLEKSKNLSDVPNTTQARANLGLGSAATKDVGTSSGNVMEVGAFGLGSKLYGVMIGDGANLNEFLVTGFYSQNLTANAQAHLNYPIQEAGCLFVYPTAGNGGVGQTYYTHGNRVFFRTLSGSWYPWRELYHTGNFNPDSKVNTGKLVEWSGGLYETGSLGTPNYPTGAISMPTGYVITGLATAGIGEVYSLRARGYRLRV